jgi:hypothetical protein
MYNREEIKNKLQRGIWKVSFTKTNGETRVMHCTLDEGLMPAHETIFIDAGESKRRSHNENTLAVWDVEKKDWRSFRIESIKSFDCEYNL